MLYFEGKSHHEGLYGKKRLALIFSFFLKATYDKALRVLKRAEEDEALDTTDGGVERGSPGNMAHIGNNN